MSEMVLRSIESRVIASGLKGGIASAGGGVGSVALDAAEGDGVVEA